MFGRCSEDRRNSEPTSQELCRERRRCAEALATPVSPRKGQPSAAECAPRASAREGWACEACQSRFLDWDSAKVAPGGLADSGGLWRLVRAIPAVNSSQGDHTKSGSGILHQKNASASPLEAPGLTSRHVAPCAPPQGPTVVSRAPPCPAVGPDWALARLSMAVHPPFPVRADPLGPSHAHKDSGSSLDYAVFPAGSTPFRRLRSSSREGALHLTGHDDFTAHPFSPPKREIRPMAERPQVAARAAVPRRPPPASKAPCPCRAPLAVLPRSTCFHYAARTQVCLFVCACL